MNPSKAWNAKLEAASFLLSKNLYKQCEVKVSDGAHFWRWKYIEALWEGNQDQFDHLLSFSFMMLWIGPGIRSLSALFNNNLAGPGAPE